MGDIYVAYWFIRWHDHDESFGVLGARTTREAAVALVADAVEEHAQEDALPRFEGDLPPRGGGDAEDWLTEAEGAIENATLEWFVQRFEVS